MLDTVRPGWLMVLVKYWRLHLVSANKNHCTERGRPFRRVLQAKGANLCNIFDSFRNSRPSKSSFWNSHNTQALVSTQFQLIIRARGRLRHRMKSSRTKKTTRSHTFGGCGTCRRRHVKCDKVRPACLSCRAIGAVCDGFRQELKWVTNPESQGDKKGPKSDVHSHSARQHLYTGW